MICGICLMDCKLPYSIVVNLAEFFGIDSTSSTGKEAEDNFCPFNSVLGINLPLSPSTKPSVLFRFVVANLL